MIAETSQLPETEMPEEGRASPSFFIPKNFELTERLLLGQKYENIMEVSRWLGALATKLGSGLDKIHLIARGRGIDDFPDNIIEVYIKQE